MTCFNPGMARSFELWHLLLDSVRGAAASHRQLKLDDAGKMLRGRRAPYLLRMWS
jgi:hypothetical protein